MKQYIPYSDVFKLAEEAVEMTGDAYLQCSVCGKPFLKLYFTEESEDEKSQFSFDNADVYTCKDHHLWDLLLDPDFGEEEALPHGSVIRKFQDDKYIYEFSCYFEKGHARIFLPGRTN